MASSPSPDPRPAVVLHGGPTALPTLLGGGTPRLPMGGKIRAGIKVLTRRAAEVPRAQAIYEQGLNQGQSFDQIERALAEACPELKSPLVPRNVPWFTVRAQDFPNPELATQILDLHGEDRGEGRRLYRFPVVFPTDRWQSVMPHELATWGAQDKRFWSEYSTDGRWRHCMTHAPVPVDATGRRTVRLFGGRKAIPREDNGGLCQPESCPEYQQRQCNLTGRFLFFIPGIRSISAFELHTRSFYAMNAAIRTFETVAFLRGGRLAGFLDRQGTPFYLTKRLMEVAHIDDHGRPVRVLQWLANHIAKTCDRKPGHYPQALSRRLAQVCNTAELTPAELRALMVATEVGAVWGVGRKIAAQLHTGGVHAVLDLVRADVATLRRQFSVVFEKTVLELRGVPCMDVEEAPAAKQQILVSRSFGEAVTQIDGIAEAVSEFASRAAEKLRLQGSVAGAIQVFIRTSPFRENDRQHSPSSTVPIRPTADSRRIVGAACEAARAMFRPGFSYAKAGVMLMDLQDAKGLCDQGELDLFGGGVGQATVAQDRRALMQTMDALNRRFGRGAVLIGSTTTAVASDTGTAAWSVRQERRTPRYTTRWEEMPVVRAS